MLRAASEGTVPSPLQPGRACPLCSSLSLKVCRWEPFEVWVLLRGWCRPAEGREPAGWERKQDLTRERCPPKCGPCLYIGDFPGGHREGRSLVQPHTCRQTWGSTLWLSFRGAMDTSTPEICPRYGLPGARDAEAPGTPHLKDDHMWVCTQHRAPPASQSCVCM